MTSFVRKAGIGLAIGLVLASPLSAQTSDQPFEACERHATLSAAGVGVVRIGMSADSLTRMCKAVSREVVTGSFGTITHVVRAGGAELTVIEVAGRVQFLRVSSPLHRTLDSLGVGTPIDRILEEPDLHHATGDSPDRYVLSPRQGALCGLSFWLEPRVAELASQARGNILHLIRMRGAGAVASIDVHGPCRATEKR